MPTSAMRFNGRLEFIVMPNFKFYAVNGMDKTLIEADSIELVDEAGNTLELHPRKSDGDITLYAKQRLVIRPLAGNCANVSSEA